MGIGVGRTAIGRRHACFAGSEMFCLQFGQISEPVPIHLAKQARWKVCLQGSSNFVMAQIFSMQIVQVSIFITITEIKCKQDVTNFEPGRV